MVPLLVFTGEIDDNSLAGDSDAAEVCIMLQRVPVIDVGRFRDGDAAKRRRQAALGP
jgi:hypothetical protein